MLKLWCFLSRKYTWRYIVSENIVLMHLLPCMWYLECWCNAQEQHLFHFFAPVPKVWYNGSPLKDTIPCMSSNHSHPFLPLIWLYTLLEHDLALIESPFWLEHKPKPSNKQEPQMRRQLRPYTCTRCNKLHVLDLPW